jgi:hypothetical protein
MPIFYRPIEATQFSEAMALGKDDLPPGVAFFGRHTYGNGEIISHTHRTENHVRVEIGDWVVEDFGHVRIFTDAAFKKQFIAAELLKKELG